MIWYTDRQSLVDGRVPVCLLLQYRTIEPELLPLAYSIRADPSRCDRDHKFSLPSTWRGAYL